MDLLPGIVIVAPIIIGVIVMNRRQRHEDEARGQRHRDELGAATRLAELQAAEARHRSAALDAVESSRHGIPPFLP